MALYKCFRILILRRSAARSVWSPRALSHRSDGRLAGVDVANDIAAAPAPQVACSIFDAHRAAFNVHLLPRQSAPCTARHKANITGHERHRSRTSPGPPAPSRPPSYYGSVFPSSAQSRLPIILRRRATSSSLQVGVFVCRPRRSLRGVDVDGFTTEFHTVVQSGSQEEASSKKRNKEVRRRQRNNNVTAM